MNTKQPLKIGLCAIAIVGFISTSQAQMRTVGVLNPTPPPPGIVNSPANALNPVFLSVGNMALDVATAYASNNGGVIDWEGANGWIANGQNLVSQTVSYGTAQANLLTITRIDTNPASLFGPTTLSGTPTTSGTNYLGFAGVSSPVVLNFSKGLDSWGMTELNRGASRTVTFSFTLLNGTVINYAPEIQNPSGNNLVADNWFGISVNDLNPITSVSFTADGFVRFDDMAFIVSLTPIPEPATSAILGLGSLVGIMALRRRRS
jgi:hypothetical protein